MKRTILPASFFILFLFFAGKTEHFSHIFKNGEYKIDYETKDGMFDGNYISYYANGKKRAEGKFSSNQRYGKWSIYDSLGKLVLVRDYENNFQYEQLFPESKSKVIAPPYTLVRNETGYYIYYGIIEKEVLYNKRTWRYIPFAETNPIFTEDILFNALMDSVAGEKIQAYSTADDEFKVKLAKQIVDVYSDSLRSKIIGYKIKEDCFYDSKRKISEKRIIGICPVMQNVLNEKDSVDICWFYFPEIRNTLNAIKINTSNHKEKQKTLDDLFFFHSFQSIIYKETNVKNQSFKDYCKTSEKLYHEHLRTEIELIETEHDFWMK